MQTIKQKLIILVLEKNHNVEEFTSEDEIDFEFMLWLQNNALIDSVTYTENEWWIILSD